MGQTNAFKTVVALFQVATWALLAKAATGHITDSKPNTSTNTNTNTSSVNTDAPDNACAASWPVFDLMLVPVLWVDPWITPPTPSNWDRNATVNMSGPGTLALPPLDTWAVAKGRPWSATIAFPPGVESQMYSADECNIWLLAALPPRNRITQKPEGGFADRAVYKDQFLAMFRRDMWYDLVSDVWGKDDPLPLSLVKIPTTRCPECGVWLYWDLAAFDYYDGNHKRDSLHVELPLRVCPEGFKDAC